MFQEVILTFAVLGVVINVVAFVIISKKKHKSMFHDLLKILTAYDVAVVICCALQFALPVLWSSYSTQVYPHILQYLLPVMHVAVMTSVYSTILISFERYIRICFYCQLRETSVLSEENVKYYKLFVILFPLLFYVPKFFEVRTHYDIKEVNSRIDCQKYMSLAALLDNPLLKSFIVKQFTPEELNKIEFLATACTDILSQERANQTQLAAVASVKDKRSLPNKTNPEISENISVGGSTNLEDSGGILLNKKTADVSSSAMYRNVTISRKRVLEVTPTALRRNVYYYQIYYVYLNTLFASVLPLALLLFFNISTAIELIKMSRLESRALAAQASSVNMSNQIMVNTDNRGRSSTVASVARNGSQPDNVVRTALAVAATAHTQESQCNHSMSNGHHSQNAAEKLERETLLLHPKPKVPDSHANLPHIDAAEEEDHRNHVPTPLPMFSITVYDQDNNGIQDPEQIRSLSEILNSDQLDRLDEQGEEDVEVDHHLLVPEQAGNRRNTVTYLVPAEPADNRGVPDSGMRMLPNSAGNSQESGGPSRNNSVASSASASNISSKDGYVLCKGRSWKLRPTRRRTSSAASSILPTNGTTLRITLARAISSARGSRGSTGSREVTSLNRDSVQQNSSSSSSAADTKKELRLARISLCIVWLFLFCHVWKLVPTFYSTFIKAGGSSGDGTNEDADLDISVKWPNWLEIIEEISHTLITLNSSLNFLIYVVL